MSNKKPRGYKPATLEEILEESKKFAKEDTRDGLDTRYVCKHECECSCHVNPKKQAATCCKCKDCYICGLYVDDTSLHLKECHPDKK
ncbi:MAG: hypothetical protein Q7S19_02480 [bacterium]|nr:hypothetical protein [bacterium]